MAGPGRVFAYALVFPWIPTVPGWGSDEDLQAFRKTGDAAACKDSIFDEDLSRARELGLPAHAVTFVNGLLFLENPTRENVSKLTGVAVD